MRRLFGSGRKGKRLLDKAVKEGHSRGKNLPVDQPIDEYNIVEHDISEYGFDEYNIDGYDLTEHHAGDYVIPEEYPIEEYPVEEHPVDDDMIPEGFLPDDYAVQKEQPVDESAVPEEKPLQRDRHKKSSISRKQIVYASMIIVGVFFAAIALRVILGDVFEDAAARNEYEQLRENFPEISGQGTEDEASPDVPGEESETEEERQLRDMSLDELAAINRDFVGWINANNNVIDYPIVRGSDNERYINTTFFGTQNSAGTIFMDHRHSLGFNENIVILYGHHTRDGSMFTSLVNHLDANYRRNNPTVTITTRDGRRMTYSIFAAKLTDAWDPAYATVGTTDIAKAVEAFPNAPANAARYLLLSTCTRSNDENERILVFAALS